MIKYELSFTEALQVLEKGEGWVQGEYFSDGVVLMFDTNGWTGFSRDYLHVHDFSSRVMKSALQITQGIMSQKYRIVRTQPDAERKCK